MKSRKLIDKLFKEGKTISSGPLKAFFLNGDELNFFGDQNSGKSVKLKFGVGVSTKKFKKAVDRNRVKRIIREAFRLQKPEFMEKLDSINQQVAVFFLYTAKELPQFEPTLEKTVSILNKLSREIENKVRGKIK